jgi:hypothetical protein
MDDAADRDVTRVVTARRANFPLIVNQETWTRPGSISSADEESKIVDLNHRKGGNVGPYASVVHVRIIQMVRS